MTATLALFYLFGFVLLASALVVITARNPVHAAMFLVLSFVTASAIWLLLHAEFLAITLILVYVGAVMVLFLFVVMMLDINFDRLREGFWKHLPIAIFVGVVMAVEMVLVVTHDKVVRAIPSSASPGEAYSNTKALGRVLYTDYLLPFELAAVILLVAIVAAIALTLRTRKETKYQDAREQLSANAANRLRVVKGVK